MLTTAFWKATAERAIRTAAQAFIAATSLDVMGLVGVDWGDALSLASGGGLLAVLTAVATSRGTEGPGVTEQVARGRHAAR